MRTRASLFVASLLLLATAFVGFQAFAQAQTAEDPIVRKIIELGTKDN